MPLLVFKSQAFQSQNSNTNNMIIEKSFFNRVVGEKFGS